MKRSGRERERERERERDSSSGSCCQYTCVIIIHSHHHCLQSCAYSSTVATAVMTTGHMTLAESHPSPHRRLLQIRPCLALPLPLPPPPLHIHHRPRLPRLGSF